MTGWIPRRIALPVLVLGLAFVALSPAFAQPKSAPVEDPKASCYRWPAGDYDGDGVVDRLDRCNDTPKGCQVDAYGCSIDTDGDGVCDGLDQCPDTPRGEKADSVGCSPSQRSGRRAVPAAPETPRTPPPAPTPAPTPPPPAPAKPISEVERQLVSGGKVRLENIYFETNSANLLPESEATLNDAGEALAKYSMLKVEVQGHTDTRGSAAYNLRLSQSRAESVRKYLLDHYSLRPENVVAKGYGETQPETKERNDEERLRNRRVVLKVLNPEALPKNVKYEGH